MPTELHGTLYDHENLYVVMTMLKDIYAKKPQQNVAAVATRVAQGASTPFTLICSPTRDSPKVQLDASLEDKTLQLTETLYHMDLNGKPTHKPFKPIITLPRRYFKTGFDKGCNGYGRHFTQPRGQSFHLINAESTKDLEEVSDSKGHLKNLTKVQPSNIPESLVNHSTKIEFAASDVWLSLSSIQPKLINMSSWKNLSCQIFSTTWMKKKKIPCPALS